jgi:hypothetical protein
MARTYFISGHRDITEDEFIQHYEPILWEKINEPDVKFVVGDCQGADTMAQKYLKSMGMKNEVTVYHMFEDPRHNSGFGLIGGFNSDDERDFAMTESSDKDIAWVKPGRERSGTQQNINRRKWVNERITKGLEVSLTEWNKE